MKYLNFVPSDRNVTVTFTLEIKIQIPIKWIEKSWQNHRGKVI